MQTNTNPLDYVLLAKLAELSGYSEKALRQKISKGQFVEGVHYIRSPDGRIHFHLQRYQDWLVNNTPRGSASITESCGFPSNIADHDVVKL